MTHPPRATHPSDAWVQCGCGAKHWGTFGAAGLLLADGVPAHRLVLQHRALWSHHGGTWGLPGGALLPEESAVVGAVREAVEEAGIDAANVRPHATWTLTHPDWSYTTVLARMLSDFTPSPTDAESLDVAWVAVDGVPSLPLLPAFADAWPTLRWMLDLRPVVVIDAANVVGSRPNGWWRDRAGANERLRDELDVLARVGFEAALLRLPGGRWWPDLVLVTEGQGRGVSSTERVQVVEAPGSGDDAVVEAVHALRDSGREARGEVLAPRATSAVTVVTADRELRERVTAVGARTIGPRALLS